MSPRDINRVFREIASVPAGKWVALGIAAAIICIAFLVWPRGVITPRVLVEPNGPTSMPIVKVPINSLSTTFKDEEAAALQKQIPPLRWAKERTSNIAKETLPELVENLANLDDNLFAETSVQSAGYTEAHGQSLIVTRLSRVRRLLEEAKQNRDEVVKLLRGSLEDTPKHWEKAFVEFYAALSTGKKLSQPEDFFKLQKRALAATYILPILEDYESLSLILAGDEFYANPRRAGPVPRAIILYAAHKLIETYPAENLSSVAKTARDEYLKMADPLIPPMRHIKVTRWNATYEESDPMIQAVDRDKVLLRGQPMTTLEIFPTNFADGKPMSSGVKASPRLIELLVKAKAFAAAANFASPK